MYALKSASSSSEVSLRRFIAAYYYTEHIAYAKTGSGSKKSGKAKWYTTLFHILDMDFDGKILKTNICDFVNSLILIDDIKILFSDDSSNDNNLIIVDDLNIRFNDMVDEFFLLSTSSMSFEFMNEAEFVNITERGASAFPHKLNTIFLRLVNYIMFNEQLTFDTVSPQQQQQQQQQNILPPLPQPTVPQKDKDKTSGTHNQHHKKHHYPANREQNEDSKEAIDKESEGQLSEEQVLEDIYKVKVKVKNEYEERNSGSTEDPFRKPHKHRTTNYDDGGIPEDIIVDTTVVLKDQKKGKKSKKQAVKKPTKPLPPTPPPPPPQQQKLSTKSLPNKGSGSTPQSARSKTMVNVPPRDTAYYLSSGATIMSPTTTPIVKSSSNGDLGGVLAPTTTSNNTSTKNSATDDMSADIGSEVGTDTHGVVGGISSTGASLEEGGDDDKGGIGGYGGPADYFGGWRARGISGRKTASAAVSPYAASRSCNLGKVPFSSASSSSSDFNFVGDDDRPNPHGRIRRNPPKANTLRIRSSNTATASAAALAAIKKDPLAASLSALPKYPPMVPLFPLSSSSSKQKLPQILSQSQPQPQPQQQQQQYRSLSTIILTPTPPQEMPEEPIDVTRFTTPPYQPPGRKSEDLFVLCMRSMENGEYHKAAALAQQSLVALPDNAEPRCRVPLTSYYVALRILNTLQCAQRDPGAVPAPRLAMLAGWLTALPMHKEHKEASLLIASLYSEVAARATQTFVPECAPLAVRFAPKGVPGYVMQCRKCGARCNAAFPRCAMCGTQVLYCCFTLCPIEGKGRQLFKCAFCKATFSDMYSENKFECPICKRVALILD